MNISGSGSVGRLGNVSLHGHKDHALRIEKYAPNSEIIGSEVQQPQDVEMTECPRCDEISPTGPAPTSSPMNIVCDNSQENDLEVQQQLIELIHVLRRIALARRVSLESAKRKPDNRCDFDGADCSTQQIVDLLLLAKNMAAQAMTISRSRRSGPATLKKSSTSADDHHISISTVCGPHSCY